MPETPVIRRSRRAALTSLALLLLVTSGCVRLGNKPPNQLLGITIDSSITPGQALSGSTSEALFVEMPGTPKAIATQRMAVRDGANSYSYVAKALWVDTPAHQFQALLSETIAAKTGQLVLDPGQYPAQAGHVLHGTLVEFGVDARARQAIVTYDATLLAADGITVRHQRFSATRPTGAITGDNIAPAISAAANEVAAAVASWVGTP